MALPDKKPNGGHHCEMCGRKHVIEGHCDVKYDHRIKLWLCNLCWANTAGPKTR